MRNLQIMPKSEKSRHNNVNRHFFQKDQLKELNVATFWLGWWGASITGLPAVINKRSI